jgi:hexosaminidase
MHVVVDLGEVQQIHDIGAGFLQDQDSWIFMPASVRFQTSVDGDKYTDAGMVQNPINPKQSGGIVHDFMTGPLNIKARFIQVTATSQGPCPDWHVGAGNPGWIFADEIWTK